MLKGVTGVKSAKYIKILYYNISPRKKSIFFITKININKNVNVVNFINVLSMSALLKTLLGNFDKHSICVLINNHASWIEANF